MTDRRRRGMGPLAVIAAAGLTGAVPAQWVQTHELKAEEPPPGDQFGWSISNDGELAIVGARLFDEAGAAFVFDVATGRQLHELTADDAAAGDGFGGSVSITGALALVGAPGDGSGAGSAYLFDALSGRQLHKLTASDGAAGDALGTAVSVSGSLVVVGAPDDDDTVSGSGSAYVFDAITGKELHKLNAGDPGTNDQFGGAVAISGALVLVGSPSNNFPFDSGAAYVFDAATGGQLHKLTSPEAAVADFLGTSVSISGEVALLGAPGDDNQGSAFLFDAATGQLLRKLTANDAALADLFGLAVSVREGLAIVGAPRGPLDNGSAYIFDVTSGRQLERLDAAKPVGGDGFGWCVSISGDVAAVGALSLGAFDGAAYAFDGCGADLDDDGEITTSDLATVILDWGCLEPGRCEGDANRDGVVDLQDLVSVILNWGACGSR